MSLGKNIYNLRKEKGYSQEELAHKCKVSRQAISKWEADEVMPDTNNLLMLSKIFHITIDELLENEVHTAKPDTFDKSVRLVRKHWAKIGYYLIYSGIVALVFYFLSRAMTSSFLRSESMYGDFFNDFSNPVADPFTFMSNFVLIFGIIILAAGIGLVIYDYRKNRKF